MITAIQQLAANEALGLEADEAMEVYFDVVFSPCMEVVVHHTELRDALTAEGHAFNADCSICRCTECDGLIHRSAFCPGAN
jgi:hypothetical protein